MHQVRQQHLSFRLLQPAQHVKAGDPLAVIQARGAGLNEVIVEGDGPGQLRGGPGHRPGTPLPGREGTSVISAHRWAYGGPFAALDRIEVGDRLVVKAANQRAVAYVVTSKRVQRPSWSPQPPSPERRLALETRGPGLFAKSELVVEAREASPASASASESRVSKTTVPPSSGHALAGIAAGAGWLAALAVVLLGARGLKARWPRPARLAAGIPIGAFAAMHALLALDGVLPRAF